TMPVWSRSIGARVALGALAVAIVVTGWSIARALHADVLPDASPPTLASLERIDGGSHTALSDLQAVVENDLFSPDRSAPAGQYRMPGEHGPDDKPVVEPMQPVVLGT